MSLFLFCALTVSRSHQTGCNSCYSSFVHYRSPSFSGSHVSLSICYHRLPSSHFSLVSASDKSLFPLPLHLSHFLSCSYISRSLSLTPSLFLSVKSSSRPDCFSILFLSLLAPLFSLIFRLVSLQSCFLPFPVLLSCPFSILNFSLSLIRFLPGILCSFRFHTHHLVCRVAKPSHRSGEETLCTATMLNGIKAIPPDVLTRYFPLTLSLSRYPPLLTSSHPLSSSFPYPCSPEHFFLLTSSFGSCRSRIHLSPPSLLRVTDRPSVPT